MMTATAGIDNLSSKLLKDAADMLVRPISQLCNLFIKLNSFPRSCEIAKVKPLFKKGSKTDPQNYRPISLLSILSKITERIIHDQTQEFLSKNKILNSYYSPSNLICGVPQGSILGPLLFLLYMNYLPHAVVSDLLLYAGDTCIVFLHKNVTEIKKQLLRDFSSLCDWFVEGFLSVHFGQDKTKSILFGTNHKLRNAKALNIVCNCTEIKQYEKVKYLGCILGQSLSGESMALSERK